MLELGGGVGHSCEIARHDAGQELTVVRITLGHFVAQGAQQLRGFLDGSSCCWACLDAGKRAFQLPLRAGVRDRGGPVKAVGSVSMSGGAIADRLGLASVQRQAAYWAAPLRYLGCTSHAHDAAVLFGDEIDARARSLLLDAYRKARCRRRPPQWAPP